jgi:hypothetical protein
MKKLSRIGHALLLVSLAAGLASCGGQATPEPEATVDVAMVKTDAVRTHIAQLTAEAPVPTVTTAPTATEKPAEPTLPVLATAAPALIMPTATATRIVYTGGGGAAAPTVNTYVDQGQWVYQNPSDGTILKPGQDFDAVWRIKNVGRRNWNNQFYFKYLSGTPKGVNFDMDMLPPTNIGDTVTVTVDMVAPLEPGTYTSQWTLVNDDAVSFFKFFITIRVQ